MKKLLLLTYYWPPGSGPGVQRWLKFCKFLPENGWQPEVITVKDGSYPSHDESLLDDIPESMTVHRTKSLEPFAAYNLLRGKTGKNVEVGMSNLKGKPSLLKRVSKYVRANWFIPDARVGWNTYAFPQAIKIIKSSNPDLIITTGPPHSTHLMGQKLKAMFDIPWVADFRDPWTTIYYNEILNRSAGAEAKDQRFEQSVLDNVDGLVVATPGLREEFHPRTSTIAFIPNGYDDADFGQKVSTPNPKLTISYIGNLKEVQHIPEFWQALSNIHKKHGDVLKLHLTGNVASSIQEAIKTHGLEEIVQIDAFVPHMEAIDRMRQADVLLLPIPKSDGNRNILTGKIFEYLAARRPILSIGPTDGDAAKMLHQCGKEEMLDYTDQEGIQAFLEDQLSLFKQDKEQRMTGNEDYKKYSRAGTTQQLADFINKELK